MESRTTVDYEKRTHFAERLCLRPESLWQIEFRIPAMRLASTPETHFRANCRHRERECRYRHCLLEAWVADLNPIALRPATSPPYAAEFMSMYRLLSERIKPRASYRSQLAARRNRPAGTPQKSNPKPPLGSRPLLNIMAGLRGDYSGGALAKPSISEVWRGHLSHQLDDSVLPSATDLPANKDQLHRVARACANGRNRVHSLARCASVTVTGDIRNKKALTHSPSIETYQISTASLSEVHN